jgi:hypothetical protein
MLNPMDENVKTMAKNLEEQSTNIKIKMIEPFSRSTVSVLIGGRIYSLAVELKDDSKSEISEAIGNTTYSTSKSSVLSYISMFESFMKLTKLYEESQSKLSDTTDELESIKKYVKEVLGVMEKFKKSRI